MAKKLKDCQRFKMCLEEAAKEQDFKLQHIPMMIIGRAMTLYAFRSKWELPPCSECGKSDWITFKATAPKPMWICQGCFEEYILDKETGEFTKITPDEPSDG